MDDLETAEALTKALAYKYLKNCGDCAKWMTKKCPRERLITHGKRRGYSDGPSAGCWQCDQFTARPALKAGFPKEGA